MMVSIMLRALENRVRTYTSANRYPFTRILQLTATSSMKRERIQPVSMGKRASMREG